MNILTFKSHLKTCLKELSAVVSRPTETNGGLFLSLSVRQRLVAGLSPPPVVSLAGEMSRGLHATPSSPHRETVLIPESLIYPLITTFQVNNDHFKSCLLLSICYEPDSWHVIAQMLTTIPRDTLFSHFSDVLTCLTLTLLVNCGIAICAQVAAQTPSLLRKETEEGGWGCLDLSPQAAFPFGLQKCFLGNL